MDWKALGKKIAGTGATLLGGAVGGPAGASLAGSIASKLGLTSDDPAEIARALDQDPEAAAKLKQIESEERVRLQELNTRQTIAEVEAETERQRTVNETMRAELKAEGTFKSGWRPFIGWVFGLSIFFLIGALIYSIVRSPTIVSNPDFTGLLIWLFTAMAAILGVNIRQRSKDKELDAGVRRPGILQSIGSAIGGKGSGQ